MPKVTEEHRAAMRTRIQDAALVCFARKGFAAASMADIVKEADLSAGAVYLYYSSKSELMVAAGRRIMEERITALGDLDDAEAVPPPSIVFPRLLDAVLDGNPFPSLVVQVWGEAAHVPEFAAIAEKIFGEVQARFEAYLAAYFHRTAGLDEAEAQTRARETSPAALAMVQGGIVQTAVLGPAVRPRVAGSMAALLAELES
ncbi:TetR/AcrR family transcriptional regulator [Brevibacterium sp. XM4083]|nr:TetR/AcrR family transcriptional regulator [Brevibacterium sp. XM4083]